MIEIKINQSENESKNYLKVRGSSFLFTFELYTLFETFMNSNCKEQFINGFLAYLTSNNELLKCFKECINDPEFKRSIGDLIKRNEDLYDKNKELFE